MANPLFVQEKDGRVIVKPAVIYPHYLKLLGVSQINAAAELEVARRCFTEDIAQIVGTPLHLVIQRDPKFALRQYPGAEAAEAMAHHAWQKGVYKRLPGTPAKRLGII